MRIGQIRQSQTNKLIAAIFEKDGSARAIPEYTLYDVLRIAEMEGNALSAVAARLAAAHAEPQPPAIPIVPREVWACGCTYQASSSFRDAEHGTREGFYAHVYDSPRPEIFFKGTARVCTGPDSTIGLRSDAKFTAPEPELALILGAHGKIVGYTIANDVSAWDIERENPLYLPQSKVYTACCSLGPVIVTADELTNPYSLDMRCTIRRGDATIFDGSVNTDKIHRKFENMIEYLYRANPVPSGSVLLTGTGIIVTEESALQPGDVVNIQVAGIGTLTNTCAIVG
ncbi:MAG TPA: fumarylacetoacetate hydrolase family protein [Bryobacteraceae bacterium]|nr:fumarylacetoacetate hydrolase family protein [Bryobacteraceae bacterium]